MWSTEEESFPFPHFDLKTSPFPEMVKISIGRNLEAKAIVHTTVLHETVMVQQPR